MSYCNNCGAQLQENAKFCSVCGAPANNEPNNQNGANYYSNVQPNVQQNVQPNVQPNNYNQYAQPYNNTMSQPKDSGSWGWGVLGFFVPVVGLVLFLVWHSEKPKSAKAAGIGALISVILGVIIYILYFIFVGVLMTDLLDTQMSLLENLYSI